MVISRSSSCNAAPIRYTAAKPASATHTLEVLPKMLSAGLDLPQDAAIQEVFRYLVSDTQRTEFISATIIQAYREGRRVLVLTERTDHLDFIEQKLLSTVDNLFTLHGRMSKKQRAQLIGELNNLPPEIPRVLLATGRLIGEGFDHPPLDTLVLAMPISWKGTLQQYAGRLHREHTTAQGAALLQRAIERFGLSARVSPHTQGGAQHC